MDCMKLLANTPDKHYELAIVDPPYGIGDKLSGYENNKNPTRQNKLYRKNRWDVIPPIKYFHEIIRCSKNQIVWGGNYFSHMLHPSRGWIYWDKLKFSIKHSAGELAWTSFDLILKEVKIQHHGFLIKDKYIIHPTQKPVALYKWLLHNYAKPGDKILDTHLGSGSIAIACHDMGFDLTATELDKDYYDAAMKRLNNHQKQLKLL